MVHVIPIRQRSEWASRHLWQVGFKMDPTVVYLLAVKHHTSLAQSTVYFEQELNSMKVVFFPSQTH